MDFGQRLRELRKERKLTQGDLADILKMERSSISKYEQKSGVTPSLETQIKLADFFGVTIDYLLGRENANKEVLPEGLEKPRFKKVPLLGEIACGVPITAQENIEEYVGVLNETTCDFSLRCKGDSMLPMLHDGDIVLIRQQPDVYDGQVAAILIDGSATLKHVYHLPNRKGLQLVSDNPMYAPMLYTQENSSDVQILGLAVAYIHEMI